MIKLTTVIDKSVHLSPKKFLKFLGDKLECCCVTLWLQIPRKKIFLPKGMMFGDALIKIFGNINLIETPESEVPRLNISDADLDPGKFHPMCIIHRMKMPNKSLNADPKGRGESLEAN